MTNLDPIVRALREQLPELEILEYEPMRAHCSFRIGGPARALVRPASAEETAAVCRIVRDGGAQPLLIGNGTNLLFADEGVERLSFLKLPAAETFGAGHPSLEAHRKGAEVLIDALKQITAR